MKKLVKICLAFALAYSATSVVQIGNVEVVEAKTFQNFNYEEKGEGIYITHYNGKEETVTIPSMIDDKPVIGIESQAFAECRGIKKIVLPQTLKRINDYAFSRCTELETIVIPDSVTRIGAYVFKECISLKSVNIPSGISAIPEGMFSGCAKLENIELHDGLNVIGDAAFQKCTSLQTIQLPSTIEKINAYAFEQCVKLKNVQLPEKVDGIGIYAFSKCSSLESITLPESLTGIGDNAFFNCVNLKNVKIPSKVTVIPSSAFSGCSSLSNIELPAGLTAINTAAFSACSSLQNITLPEGLETIGESAFAACVSLKNIDFPDSLTSIGVSAFSDCDSLISVTIPSKVKKLYRETFRHCNQLQHVIIPDSVAEMEAWVFANCPSLETVMMPASILMSKIGSNIFLESPNVTAIVKEKSGAYSYCVNNKVDYRIVKNNVEISQSALEMRKGTKKELSLVTSNGVVVSNDRIKWESDNGSVATVQNGVVTAIGVGKATISATYNGTKVNCMVTVNDVQVPIKSLSISGPNKGLVNKTLRLTAEINPEDTTEDKTITWNSKDISKAIVNGNGVVQLLAPGEVVITASAGNVQAEYKINIENPIESVQLNPNRSQEMKVGDKMLFRASVSPIDTTSSTELTWESSNPNVASVDQEGMVIARSTGQTTIKVTSSNGKVARCIVSVKDVGQIIPIKSVTLDYESANLEVDETLKLTATINPENTTESKTLTWESSNSDIVSVDNNGLVTAKKEGDAIITVTTSNNLKDTCAIHVGKQTVEITSVQLNKSSLTLTEGNEETLVATILPADTTMEKVLTWSSNNDAVAMVDQQGKVTALTAGKATITVTTVNNKTATCEVTVKKQEVPIESVALNTDNAVLRAGSTITLTATINPENTTMDKALVWSTNAENVAKVDQQGKVTAVGAGEAIITVKTVNGKTATCKVSVFTVSLDALNETIKRAEALNAESYTASSYADVSSALAEAKEVQKNSSATQDAIDTAQKKLDTAINALVERASQGSIAALSDKVAEYQKLANDYSKEEFAAMAQALAEANAILDKAENEISQKEVNSALTKLDAEKAKLDVISARKNLQEVIKKADKILNDEADNYTEESIQALAQAVEAAKSVLSDPNAKLTALNASAAAVNTAIDALDPIVHSDADKSVLASFVEMVKDTNAADYSVHSYRVFTDALANAQKVLADDKAKQSDVDQALDDLLIAYSSLKSSVPYANLGVELDFAKKILDNSELYIADSIEGLQEAYDKAMKVYSSDEVTSTDIKKATDELRAIRILARLK